MSTASLAQICAELVDMRREVQGLGAGIEALTNAVGTQAALLDALLVAVTADEPEEGGLAETLIRIAEALEAQGERIDAMWAGIDALPGAIRAARP